MNSECGIPYSKFLKNPVSDGGIFVIFAPMKHLSLSAFLLLLAVLAACNSREAREMEDALEQAVAVYGDGSLDVEVDTVVFIPGLSEASSYFANKKQYQKAALAALLNGYSEKNFDKEAAMLSFKAAEHYGELVHDSLTVARAEYWMGKMLYYDDRFEDALSLLKNANLCFGDYYAEKALSLNVIAGCYILLQEYGNADSCLSQSLVYAGLENSNQVKSKALNNYAILCQLQGADDQAIAYLRMVKPDNSQQKIMNQLNLGRAFMNIGEMDSAAYYLCQTEKLLSSVNIKDETMASAYACLSQFAELQGDFAKALEYQKNNKQYIVKVKDNMETESVYRIQQQYDYETIRNEMNKKVIVRQRIILLMSLILVLVFLFLIISQKRLAVIQKQEMDAKERTLFFIRQYTELLTQQGKTMQKLAIVMDNKEDRALLDNLRATVFGKKDPWDALMDVFDTLHPNERERIARLYPELTELELKDIILSYFNVSRQDEALLLKTGIHSIDKLRTSVKRKTLYSQEKQ